MHRFAMTNACLHGRPQRLGEHQNAGPPEHHITSCLIGEDRNYMVYLYRDVYTPMPVSLYIGRDCLPSLWKAPRES